MHDAIQLLLNKLKDRRPVVKDVAGQPYAIQSDGTLGAAIRPLAPQWTAPTLQVRTLAGLIEAYKQKLDGLVAEDVVVQVVDYDHVILRRLKADEYGRRHIYVDAKYKPETPYTFGEYYTQEKFTINFSASFHLNDDAVMVLKLVSTLSSASSVTVADDGYSQRTTITQDNVTRQSVDIPKEIPLIPWRTFHEPGLPLVVSKYMLRLRGIKDTVPTIALHEVDGKWRTDTMAGITAYIRKELPKAVVIG
jgi:hypothetical protein